MKNYPEEIHTLGCGCNSVYIACNLGNGTAGDLGTGILCAVLSQRELSERGTKQSIYGRLSAQNLAEQFICFDRRLRAGRYIPPGP
jgi:hypothetical protein